MSHPDDAPEVWYCDTCMRPTLAGDSVCVQCYEVKRRLDDFVTSPEGFAHTLRALSAAAEKLDGPLARPLRTCIRLVQECHSREMRR